MTMSEKNIYPWGNWAIFTLLITSVISLLQTVYDLRRHHGLRGNSRQRYTAQEIKARTTKLVQTLYIETPKAASKRC